MAKRPRYADADKEYREKFRREFLDDDEINIREARANSHLKIQSRRRWIYPLIFSIGLAGGGYFIYRFYRFVSDYVSQYNAVENDFQKDKSGENLKSRINLEE